MQVTFGRLTRLEGKIRQALVLEGLSEEASTALAVVMNRGFSRPRDSLITLLRRYPGMERLEAAAGGVDELLGASWLVEELEMPARPDGLVRPAGDAADRIENLLSGDARALWQSRSAAPIHDVSVVGQLADPSVFGTFRQRLKGAQREICYWGFSTDPTSAQADVLIDRARNGVRVRVLLASPAAAERVRGGAKRQLAEDVISKWREATDGIRGIRIRMVNRDRHLSLAGSMSIDGTLVRIDVYDDRHEEGMQGTMLEAVGASGHQLNLLKTYQDAFDRAWRSGTPLSWLHRLGLWPVRSYRLWWVLVPLALAWLFHGEGFAHIDPDDTFDTLMLMLAGGGIISVLQWTLSRVAPLRSRIPGLEEVYDRG